MNHKKTEISKCYQEWKETDENLLEFYGYKKSKIKTTLTYIGYVLTLGLLRLFYHWFPQLFLYSTHGLIEFENAEKILIIDNYKGKHKTYYVEKLENLTIENERKIKCFDCKKNRYVFDENSNRFTKLRGTDRLIKRKEFFEFNGFDDVTRLNKLKLYGKNSIEIPVKTVFKLVVLEALTPFYIFQIFSLIVWFAEQYYYYTIAIILMSVCGISSSVIQTKKNQSNLRGTIEKTSFVHVLSNNEFIELESNKVVPGDVIQIPKNGCLLHCDVVMLNGSCVVNESMLTGESVPVLKTGLDLSNDGFYDEKEDFNHTLYCGTTVIQAEDNMKAVVIRTGFLTSKGELIKSILFPPPVDFKFERDSYKYIIILAIIATGGFLYTIISKSYRELGVWDTIIKALDIITITIPPALPAALTIGKLFALNRLKNQQIFCINSRIINISGTIDCVCFDKTGTLTEDGLDLLGVIVTENNLINPNDLDEKSEIKIAMACCHSLNLIDGELAGDPLDIKMFESTDFVLDSARKLVRTPDGSRAFEILRQNQFSSSLQRMSAIVEELETGRRTVYCKGSPEAVVRLSRDATIPAGLESILRRRTEAGNRVLAVARKPYDGADGRAGIDSYSRAAAESDLEYLGLLVFENKVKEASRGIVRDLKEARVKVAMVTGDNIRTAISVAKQCDIIDENSKVCSVEVRNIDGKLNEAQLIFDFTDTFPKSENDKVSFSMTGENWKNLKEHFPDQIPNIITHTAVFARMNSEQKQQLILELQSLGYYVAMCGDGTNDCAALKAAHAGISLSEAEASVASPFTSRTRDIRCVKEIITQGRSALVTSFGVFKFMLCYSLTEFISVIILYGIDSNLTSLQFLFIDICLVLNFAALFGYTKAYEKELHSEPPCVSLLGFVPVCSLVIHVALVIVFQIVSYHLVKLFDWYEEFVYDPNNFNYFASYENYSIFSISLFQYIITAVVFSKGFPYRRKIYTNYYLFASLILMTLICAYLTLIPANWIVELLEMKIPPNVDFAWVVLLLALVNFVVAFVLEDYFVDGFLAKKIKPIFVKNRALHFEIEEKLKYTGWFENLFSKRDTTIDLRGFDNRGFVNEKL